MARYFRFRLHLVVSLTYFFLFFITYYLWTGLVSLMTRIFLEEDPFPFPHNATDKFFLHPRQLTRIPAIFVVVLSSCLISSLIIKESMFAFEFCNSSGFICGFVVYKFEFEYADTLRFYELNCLHHVHRHFDFRCCNFDLKKAVSTSATNRKILNNETIWIKVG